MRLALCSLLLLGACAATSKVVYVPVPEPEPVVVVAAHPKAKALPPHAKALVQKKNVLIAESNRYVRWKDSKPSIIIHLTPLKNAAGQAAAAMEVACKTGNRLKCDAAQHEASVKADALAQYLHVDKPDNPKPPVPTGVQEEMP